MILILGGAGYIGSHVNKFLSEKGYDTLVLDDLSYGHEDFVKWGEFVEGSIGDKSFIDSVFEEYDIDAVMHFAGFTYVGESVVDPKKYYLNNVANTLNLLMSMVEHDVDKFIFSSTCAVYGNPVSLPLVEDHSLNPISPYGMSKLMVEKILEDFSRAYDFKYVSLRYFNASGADRDCLVGELHDPETHLIPLVLDAAMGRRDSISVFGSDYDTPDGTCIRDYIHVEDLADAHLRALDYLEDHDSDVFNLGNGNGFSVMEIIDKCCDVTGCDIDVVMESRRAGDPPVLVGSFDKARDLLGWVPVNSDLDNVISSAWAWHKKVFK